MNALARFSAAAVATLFTSLAAAQTAPDAGSTPAAVPSSSPPATPSLPAPVPAPAATPPAAESARAPASTSSLPDADRGGRGETCRARLDCKAGLACFDGVCSDPSEQKSCTADSECDAAHACENGRCAARPRAAADAPSPSLTTLDLDETLSSRSAVYSGYAGYGSSLEQTQTTLSSILGVRHRTGHVELEASIPLVIEADAKSSMRVAGGDLAFGAYYTRETESMRFRAGGAVALPTAPSSSSQYALSNAASARGFDRLWLWAPEVVSIVPSVRIGSTDRAVFQHATEVAFAPMLATGGGDRSMVTFQISEDVGAHVSAFRGGARAEMVMTSGNSTDTQLSILPYVGIDGDGGFADLGLLVNLNEPAGFSFDSSKFWGLRLRGGLRF